MAPTASRLCHVINRVWERAMLRHSRNSILESSTHMHMNHCTQYSTLTITRSTRSTELPGTCLAAADFQTAMSIEWQECIERGRVSKTRRHQLRKQLNRNYNRTLLIAIDLHDEYQMYRPPSSKGQFRFMCMFDSNANTDTQMGNILVNLPWSRASLCAIISVISWLQ